MPEDASVHGLMLCNSARPGQDRQGVDVEKWVDLVPAGFQQRKPDLDKVMPFDEAETRRLSSSMRNAARRREGPAARAECRCRLPPEQASGDRARALDLRDALRRFLIDEDNRRVSAFIERHDFVEVRFSLLKSGGHEIDPFFNITPLTILPRPSICCRASSHEQTRLRLTAGRIRQDERSPKAGRRTCPARLEGVDGETRPS